MVSWFESVFVQPRCVSGSFQMLSGERRRANSDRARVERSRLNLSSHLSQTIVCVSQVLGGVNGQLFSLANSANSRTISEGISQKGSSEVVYRSFTSVPIDVYYWVLPEGFRGDKVRGKTTKTRVD